MHGSKTVRSRQGQGDDTLGSVARKSRVDSSYLPKEKGSLRRPTTDQNSADQRNAKNLGMRERADKERQRTRSELEGQKEKLRQCSKKEKRKPRVTTMIRLVSRRIGLFATDATRDGLAESNGRVYGEKRTKGSFGMTTPRVARKLMIK